MAKKNKALIYGGIVLGAAVIGTVLYFTVFKKSIPKIDNGQGGSGGSGGSGGGSGTGGGSISQTLSSWWDRIGVGQSHSGSSPAGTTYLASAISEKPGKVTINIAYPRPPKGSIVAGQTVNLSNFGKYNGDYKVQMVWIDTSVAVGAIFINTNKATTTSVDNTEFSGKGKITLK